MQMFVPRLPPPVAALVHRGLAHTNVVMFVAGFLFDVVTIGRIDSRADLTFQLIYLLALTALLLLQHREAAGLWAPPPVLRRVWSHSVELLHFLYGGLLSAFVVLYFRSSTGAKPLVFFLLLVALLLANEMPQVRRAGARLRLGLYAFCVLSFLNYFVPIVVGRMGGWVFLAALLATTALVWILSGWLTRPGGGREDRLRLCAPAAVVLALVAVCYVLRLVPPVPLAVTFQGIYHDVRRHPGGYTLVYEAPPPYRFWRRDSRPFRALPGDRVHYFLRVFAPARFTERIFTRWEHQGQDGGWRTANVIELPVRGGREEGFRTFARKSNFDAGRWRVTAETADGRALATMTFHIERDDDSEGERSWRMLEG